MATGMVASTKYIDLRTGESFEKIKTEPATSNTNESISCNTTKGFFDGIFSQINIEFTCKEFSLVYIVAAILSSLALLLSFIITNNIF